MENRVLRILYNEKHKIQEKENEIKEFKSNPLILFSELQYNRHLIPDLLLEVDERLLLEYQEWQYPLVINEMVKQFSLAPFVLSWDPDIFPSPIYLLREGYPAVAIHPYKNQFELLPSQKIKDAADEYLMSNKRRINMWEEIENLKIKMSNPFINEDESLLNTIKLSVTRSKKENAISEELAILNGELDALTDQENRSFYRLENLSREESLVKDDAMKVHRNIGMSLNLGFVDGYNKMFQEIDEQINRKNLEAKERIEELERLSIETKQY